MSEIVFAIHKGDYGLCIKFEVIIVLYASIHNKQHNGDSGGGLQKMNTCPISFQRKRVTCKKKKMK